MKNDQVMPINVHAPKWHMTYVVPIDGHFSQIFIYGLKIYFTHQGFLDFGLKIFWEGLNQKSAMISMCKIHIYIYFEKLRQNY